MKKGNIEEAKKSFINSINYDPLNAHHFYCLGIFILKTYHNSKSALEEAKRSIRDIYEFRRSEKSTNMPKIYTGN